MNPNIADYQIKSERLVAGTTGAASRYRFSVVRREVGGKTSLVLRPTLRFTLTNDGTLTNSTNGTIAVVADQGDVLTTHTATKDLTIQAEVGEHYIDIDVTDATVETVNLLVSPPIQLGVPAASLKVTVTHAAIAPTVVSPTSASITTTGATLGGTVSSDGGATITERGVVYALTSANADPLIGGTGVTKVTAAGTTGLFTEAVTGLTLGSDYTFKAYATNSVGTTYTAATTFTTASE